MSAQRVETMVKIGEFQIQLWSQGRDEEEDEECCKDGHQASRSVAAAVTDQITTEGCCSQFWRQGSLKVSAWPGPWENLFLVWSWPSSGCVLSKRGERKLQKTLLSPLMTWPIRKHPTSKYHHTGVQGLNIGILEGHTVSVQKLQKDWMRAHTWHRGALRKSRD